MKSFDFQIKASDAEAGTFTGYAAVFGNVDRGGDVILPGAFREFERTDSGAIVTLWQHDPRQPIGLANVAQDDRGLAVAGKLILADPQAEVARAHMRAGSVRGLSIGYDTLPGGAEFSDGVRKLIGVKLWEVSLVTFPMNQFARVSAAKGAMACESIAEFEDLLREALVLPTRKAKRIASAAWPILSGREAPEDFDLAAELDQFNSLLRGK